MLEQQAETLLHDIDNITGSVKYPVYVPSRGRADVSLTTRELKNSGISFYVVVEPQEYEKYLENYDISSVLKMDHNNRGISYVRNYCKQHSIENGAKFHWQFDDNITSFRYRAPTKNVKCEAFKCIIACESICDSYENIGIAGMSHTMFAFSRSNHVGINQQVYSGVLVNNDLDIWWRDDVIEDTDYSLQVLDTKYYCTLLFNKFLIDKAATMTIKGGNTDTSHAGDNRMKRSLKLQEYWPQANFQITNQYGRTKIKPSNIWKRFVHGPIPKSFNSPLMEFLK